MILRIPSSLHQQLKHEARSADLSLNKHCRAILSRKATDATPATSPVSLTLAAGGTRRIANLQDLSARVLEDWGDSIEALALYGSLARGRETAGSDIDLLVVLTAGETLDRDIYSRWRLRKFEGREVSPLFVQIPGEGERIGGLWFEVALDGIVLFDRDLLLSRFLSRVRDLIAGGEVRRMITHGHPYWVHSGLEAKLPREKGS